jgi:hypothetical protein
MEKVQMTISEGLILGYESAQRAAAGAGDDWKQAAYDAFCDFAALGQEFMTEDVRKANPHLDRLSEKRAWGVIAMKAARAGVVVKVGIRSANDPKVHGSLNGVWKRA